MEINLNYYCCINIIPYNYNIKSEFKFKLMFLKSVKK